MSKFLKEFPGGQHGQAFAMTLIVVAVTAALSIPLLSFLSSVLHRSSHANVTLKEQYSADAGTEDALWQLSKDPSFSTVLSGPYFISANQGDVTVNVAPYVPVLPPPPPPPPLHPNPGHEPLMWTSNPPGVLASGGCTPSPSQSVMYVNLSQGASPTQLTLTICVADKGQSDTTVTDIIDVLPPGFEFVLGSVTIANLVYTHSDQCGKPGGHCAGDPFPPVDPAVSTTPLWSYTGFDPYQADSKCTPYHTTNQKGPPDTQQKLEWGPWSDLKDIPRVINGQIAAISFKVKLPDTLKAGRYGDDPWIAITQNQCTGGQGLQAGMPSWIVVYKTLLVTATQGGTTLTALVEVMPPNPIQIISEQY